jgi:GNAT superfamily N-acetyltransferase
MVLIRPADFVGADAVRLTGEYHAELRQRFPSGYDPARGLPAAANDLRAPRGVFVIAWDESTAVGCGGLKTIDATTGEIKSMFVTQTHRKRGIAAAILAVLEQSARGMGFERVVLDTSEYLSEAIALYRRSGFVEIDPYNANDYATNWFEKRLRVEYGSSA